MVNNVVKIILLSGKYERSMLRLIKGFSLLVYDWDWGQRVNPQCISAEIEIIIMKQ